VLSLEMQFMHADSTDKVAVDSTKFPREQFYHSRTHSYLLSHFIQCTYSVWPPHA